MTRVIGLALVLAGITWLAMLGNVNLMHWRVAAWGVTACLGISYGLLVAIFGRWAP